MFIMDSEANGEKSSQSCFLHYNIVEKTVNMLYFSGSVPLPIYTLQVLFELLSYSIEFSLLNTKTHLC